MAAVEFITFPNCILATTAFQLSNAGAAAEFHEVLPSLNVRPALPIESCMTTVAPLGHFAPSRAYAAAVEGWKVPNAIATTEERAAREPQSFTARKWLEGASVGVIFFVGIRKAIFMHETEV